MCSVCVPYFSGARIKTVKPKGNAMFLKNCTVLCLHV